MTASVRSFGICVLTGNSLLSPVRLATIDLSKATKLQDITFRLTSLSVEGITRAFQTTILKHQELRKISIYVPHSLTLFEFDAFKRSTNYGQWLDLDRLLVQFLESRLTRPMVICATQEGGRRNMRDFAECLLPELTRRGTFDLAE